MSAHASPAAPGTWQRSVPVDEERWLTPSTAFLLLVGLIGLGIAGVRLVGALGPYSGMNDAYAWGVWKTFNVMTLTALGSGAMSVGLAAWVLGKKSLHVVMRVALVTSFLFYATGLLSLLVDVGRPWNFWNLLVPWRWNLHSPLFEVALAMPVYCTLFLSFELLPTLAERVYYRGSPRARRVLRAFEPHLRRVFPWAIAGAYLLPLGHQSSLGALMLLAGDKVDPLWQTPLLPLLYVMQAIQSGFAFVIFILMASCLVWRRPLDRKVIAELGALFSTCTFAWLALRFGDLAVRGQLGRLFALDATRLFFWAENALVLVPALVLRAPRAPRTVFRMAVLGCAGGMLYRFSPTTLSFHPARGAFYFPALPELLVSLGFIALALAGYAIAVKALAILPAPLTRWYASVEHLRAETPSIARDQHGNPIDD